MAGPGAGAIILHAKRALEGAIDLLFARPKALAGFEFTIAGFWLSFAAIVLLVPPFVISTLSEARLGIGLGLWPEDAFPWGALFAARAVELVVDWVFFPVVMALLARPLGIAARYVPYMIVRNWASVVAAAIYAIPEVLFSFGVIGGDVWLAATLVAFLIVVYYRFQVARAALGAPIGLAAGLVAFEMLSSVVVTELLDRVIGP